MIKRFADSRSATSRGRLFGLAALLGLACLGCVDRRMTVRTIPSNSLVILDGQEIGHSPVSVPFTYYGDRQIKLVKDGYETKTINQKISTPWYEFVPLDFVTEVLVPWKIHDRRNYLYSLEPSVMVPSDELLQRAADVRFEGQHPPEEALKRAKVEPQVPALTP
ncbi:PEGA domain protein [Planctomycetes bacterium Pan216]|uniref:PEGA domain protein n=1 Tax=Kolteria novifilia TaxID=2527975 RepID=A0A518BC36_9BACT|nr:PEGA domain protein [Planctomycetes bacterium Pan216]